MTHDGLLIDFGGVMTTNVFESFAAFCRAERSGSAAGRSRSSPWVTSC